MKNGLAILDSGPIFSFAALNHLPLLNHFFDEIKIPDAVWEEVTLKKQSVDFIRIKDFFTDKVSSTKESNSPRPEKDYGELEAVNLYKELSADFLVIDDKKARKIAEYNGLNCIGTVGLLVRAKEKGLVSELHPIFQNLLKRKRYFSIQLLNQILAEEKEQLITTIK